MFRAITICALLRTRGDTLSGSFQMRAKRRLVSVIYAVGLAGGIALTQAACGDDAEDPVELPNVGTTPQPIQKQGGSPEPAERAVPFETSPSR